MFPQGTRFEVRTLILPLLQGRSPRSRCVLVGHLKNAMRVTRPDFPTPDVRRADPNCTRESSCESGRRGLHSMCPSQRAGSPPAPRAPDVSHVPCVSASRSLCMCKSHARDVHVAPTRFLARGYPAPDYISSRSAISEASVHPDRADPTTSRKSTSRSRPGQGPAVQALLAGRPGWLGVIMWTKARFASPLSRGVRPSGPSHTPRLRAATFRRSSRGHAADATARRRRARSARGTRAPAQG